MARKRKPQSAPKAESKAVEPQTADPQPEPVAEVPVVVERDVPSDGVRHDCDCRKLFNPDMACTCGADAAAKKG